MIPKAKTTLIGFYSNRTSVNYKVIGFRLLLRKFLLETNKPLTVVENYTQSLSIMSRMRTKGTFDQYLLLRPGAFCYYGAKMKNIGFPL